MTADRLLLVLLRINAAIMLCAVPCAALPFEWMNVVHRDWLGLGPLHDSLITRYMARSLSLMYGLHGAVVLFLTFNWPRYRPFVPVLAWLHITFGSAMLLVGLDAGVAWWWLIGEGPLVVVYGVVLLLLYRRVK